MSSLRVLACALALLSLSACGFTPVYGNKAALDAAHGRIEVGNIPDRGGQYLRNRLIDRLYASGTGGGETPYLLEVAPLRESLTAIGLRKDASVTHTQTEVRTTFRLVEKSTGKVLMQRDVRATGDYDQLNNQFATLVSREDVINNMLADLGNTIVQQINLYFTGTHENSAAQP